jgi:endonuclease YncB( thermonuclease family)
MLNKAISAALLAVVLCASPALAGDLSGRVSRVHDGDTFTLAGKKVRLWGIDAPELKQQCGGAPCGGIARDALQELVRSRTVVCTQVDRDRYKRVVASCRAAGRDLGEAMVRSGNALDYRRYSKGRYRQAERDAQARRVGMWSGEFEKPWDHRRR